LQTIKTGKRSKKQQGNWHKRYGGNSTEKISETVMPQTNIDLKNERTETS